MIFFPMLETGQTYEQTFSYTQEEVEAFARISGDHNPIHLDAEYAAGTPFKRPIIHGFLGASVFSRILGTAFPGEGTIYLKQEMQFKRPMYVDTVYKAILTVEEVQPARHRARIATQVVQADTGKVVVDGFAEVMNAERI
ncbi:MAG: MaoC family dehydratase [Bacteroidetes bacterium]|nr:MAG: MaoC family dehydratase [Bacteroidota bacterium]